MNNQVHPSEGTTLNRVSLILEPISKRVSILPGTDVMTAILNLQLSANAICGGKGVCGKCKIIVDPKQATVSPLTEKEKKLLSADEIQRNIRLACQTQILGESRIFLTEGFIGSNAKILTNGIERALPLRPRFWKMILDLKHLPLQDRTLSDFDLIKTAILTSSPILSVFPRRFDTSYECLKTISKTIRKGDGIITVTLESVVGGKDEPIVLLDVEPGNHLHELFGVAIDLGTTTIVGYLIDLITGEVSAIESMLNPQTAIGEDIVSRMSHIQQNADGMEYAQNLVKDAIDSLIEKLAKKAGTTSKTVDEVVIVGNTVMHHIFYGLTTNYLGVAPFRPVTQNAVSIRNYHFGLKTLVKNCEIYSPPVIAGFVGADTTADILAIQMDKLEKKSLLIDIGTNGELVLGSKFIGLYTASVAAGSALEGAHITNGMRGTDGAIEGVVIDPQTWVPKIDVIGHIPPIGICGSGIIDLVAELLRVGLLTRSGKFNTSHPNFKSHPRIREGKQGYEYILHSAEHPAVFNFDVVQQNHVNGHVQEIVFTQEDIREVQKAKGAFHAGATLLINKLKLKGDELEQIFLGGAFGTYIKKQNAHFIGLIPEISMKNVFQVGNAAGAGAKMLLKNIELRKNAEKIVKTVQYVEIASEPEFQAEFARSMQFPHHDLSKFPSLKDIYAKIPER